MDLDYFFILRYFYVVVAPLSQWLSCIQYKSALRVAGSTPLEVEPLNPHPLGVCVYDIKKEEEDIFTFEYILIIVYSFFFFFKCHELL